jgi:hypothetical protein
LLCVIFCFFFALASSAPARVADVIKTAAKVVINTIVVSFVYIFVTLLCSRIKLTFPVYQSEDVPVPFFIEKCPD